jgi:hypothetical protein
MAEADEDEINLESLKLLKEIFEVGCAGSTSSTPSQRTCIIRSTDSA